MSIDLRVEDHVAWVVINRPERLNAIDEQHQRELLRVWKNLEVDRSVRVVVLTGAGDRAFCAGDDMRSTEGKTDLAYWLDARPDGFGHLVLRDTLDVPILARVNGYALGGGLELVVGCDLAVASEQAQLGFVEPRLGRLPLDGGIVSLARHLPYKWAMEVLLTGRRFTAHEARDLGLVNEVVPHDQLDAAVERWLDELLACAPLSLRAIKHIVRRTAHMTARDARMANLSPLIRVLESEDGQEGMKRATGIRWKAMLVVIAVLAVACGGEASTDTVATTQPPTTQAETTTTTEPAPTTTGAPPETTEAVAPDTVALVVNQRAGDMGPIDDLVKGLEQAETDFGLDTTFIEATDPSTFESTLRNLGNQGTDVIAVTFPPMAEALEIVAPEFPETRWIHIFGSPVELPNVVTVGFDYYKGTYLAGILAGALTSGQVGFVGGVSIPPINADYNAFVAGAVTQNAAVTGEAFADSFEDPARGRELGAALYDGGADILMLDGAATDLGVVQAAEEKGGYVIGGSESYFDSPAVIGSVLLLWSSVLYNEIENAIGDDYQAGHVGAGVAEGGVDLVVNPAFLESGPAAMVETIRDTLPLIDETRSAIKSGELEVPFDPEL